MAEAAKSLRVGHTAAIPVYKAAFKVLRARSLGCEQLRPEGIKIELSDFHECQGNPWLLRLLDYGIKPTELSKLAGQLHSQLKSYAELRVSTTARAMWLKYTWARTRKISGVTLTNLRAAKYPRFIQPLSWGLELPVWGRKKQIDFCALKRAAGNDWEIVKGGLGPAKAARVFQDFDTLRLRLELLALKQLGHRVKVLNVSRTRDAFKVEFEGHDAMLVLLSEI